MIPAEWEERASQETPFFNNKRTVVVTSVLLRRFATAQFYCDLSFINHSRIIMNEEVEVPKSVANRLAQREGARSAIMVLHNHQNGLLEGFWCPLG